MGNKRVLWGWEQEVEAARRYVSKIAGEHGWEVEMREIGAPTYQLAVVSGEGFRLCVYPHKTSAHNIHMRVRDQGSNNPAAYEFAVGELYSRSGNNCSFQPKHQKGLSPQVAQSACRRPDELQEIEREMGRPYIKGF